MGAPLAAPAALPMPAAVDAHPVIALINQLQKAGVALPDTMDSHADAARIEEAARVLPEGSSTRAQLAQLASAIRASHAGTIGGGPDGGGSVGGIYDGSKPNGASESAPAAAAPGGL